MTESFCDHAIIIKRSDWRENDSRVVLYSQGSGKLSLVARGVKRPGSKLAGHIEPLSLTDIMVLRGRTHDYLAGVVAQNAYLNLKSDLNALYFAGAALAVFDRLVKENAQDEALFAFLNSWLSTVDSRIPLTKEEGVKLYDYFLVRLLNLLGYCPELRHCAVCRQPLKMTDNHFAFRLGGVICSPCYAAQKTHYLPQEMPPLSLNCLKLLRIFSESETYPVIAAPALDRRELDRLSRMLVDFV
jgi:DNA repair protein RecO (recombination protein O)